MDLAIRREGDVHNMQPEAIKYACYLRGLNPTNLNNEEMVEWLRCWIKVSTSIKEDHITLFLHLPLFLGYNHPNNWQLIYGSSSNNKSNTNANSLPLIPPFIVSPEKQIQLKDINIERQPLNLTDFAKLETEIETPKKQQQQKL